MSWHRIAGGEAVDQSFLSWSSLLDMSKLLAGGTMRPVRAHDRPTALGENHCLFDAPSYRSRQVPIPFSKKSRRNVVRQSSENGAQNKKSTRVKLRPKKDWHKRNYLTSVFIPSLFTKRSGDYEPP